MPIVAVVMGVAALSAVPVVIGATSGCALLVPTGCLIMEEAHEAVE